MIRDWTLRLRSLFKQSAVDRELDEELRFHLEEQVEAYMRQGVAHGEAVRRARLEFGGLDQVKEEHRDARGTRLLEDLGRDVRYAIRHLRRSPGFAVSALLCLAIGIGATTTIYSVVDTILLQPLPFPGSDRLVGIVKNAATSNDLRGWSVVQRGITYQEFLDWRTQARTLADVSAVMPARRSVRTSQGVVRLWGVAVSSDAFVLVGGRAMLGRTLGVADADEPGVMVLSFAAWRRYFNSDPSIIGAAIQPPTATPAEQNAARPSIVVGVMPPDFEFPTTQWTRDQGGGEDFLTPIPNARVQRSTMVTMMARLAPGASIAAALDEANTIGASIRPPVPVNAPALAGPAMSEPWVGLWRTQGESNGPRFAVQPLKDLIVGQQRSALQALLGSVVILLLIVCANVANLLLARGTAQRRETAVRLALGASRGRLARQMMTESVVLALAGGAAGAGIAVAGVWLVKALATVDAPGIFRLNLGSTILPRAHEVGVDLKVLGIAFGLAAVTSILFGMWPALRLSRGDGMTSDGSRGMSSGMSAPRTRAGLVVGQVALATTLLVGAGLLTRSFMNATMVNNGYDSSNVVALNLVFPNQYTVARKVDTIEALLARFRARQDVQAAGFARHGLLIGERLSIGTLVPPGGTLEEFRSVRTRVRSVGEGYLTTMDVPVLEGREFQAGDIATASPAIVLNRSAARRYFGSASPVGQTLDWHYDEGRAQMTVIGVVEDLRQDSPLDDVYPEVFVEYRQFLLLLDRWKQSPLYQSEFALGVLSFAVRTRNDPLVAIPVIREAVNAVDPNVVVDAIASMDRLLGSALAHQRFYTVWLAAFASVAGLLAAIGVYGLLAYSVIQRTHELGIRIALGAPRAQLLGRVLGRGLILTTVGITLGLIGAAAITRVLQGMLFGITSLDPKTFLAVAVIFGLVTTLASYLPARRATKVDPMVALRSE